MRGLTDGVVVQANHHEAARFQKNNARIAQMESAEFMNESGDRADLLAESLVCLDSCCDLSSVLDQSPVMNADTVQKMVFFPATGEVSVWKRVG